MKATPELLQKALRVLEIGLTPEIAAKILATVRLLDEKGDRADLKDFALIEACYNKEIESSANIDLSQLKSGDTIELRNGKYFVVESSQVDNEKCYKVLSIIDGNIDYLAWFDEKGVCIAANHYIHDPLIPFSEFDIVNVIKQQS